MADLVHLRAIVQGRVQGVYYRAYAARAAKSLALTGFVRNMRNGDVELEAEGKRKDIEEMLTLLKKGPPDANVETINTTWSNYGGMYRGFDVRY